MKQLKLNIPPVDSELEERISRFQKFKGTTPVFNDRDMYPFLMVFIDCYTYVKNLHR